MEEAISELDFSGFPLGLDTTTKKGTLGPLGLRVLKGLTPDDDGGLRHAGNFRTIVPNTYHAFTFLRWSYGTNRRLLFITTDVAGTGIVYVWNELTGLLDRTIAVGLVSPTMTVGRFLQAGLTGDVFLVVGGNTNSHLYWIKDVLTTVTAEDVSSPVEATLNYPSNQVVNGVDDGVAGPLNSTGYALYQWSVSLTDDQGRKSQVSLPSPPLALVDKQARISFGGVPPVDLTAAITAGRIVSADLFRIGGKASQLRFVKTYQLAVSGGLVVDAITGDEIIDDTPEEELSFIFATTYQDPAPVGMTDIILHQSKIFGIKEFTDTGRYYSRTNNFLYWGYDDNGVDDDGGVVFPDNNTADAPNGFASEGSLLITGRYETVDALYGRGSADFAFDRRTNFANRNRWSITRSDNDTYFLGRDDLLHSLRDISSPSVSQRIKSTLKSLLDSDISRVVMGNHNGQVYLSLPVATGTLSPGIVLVFDTTRGIWRDATDSRLLSLFLLSQPSPFNGELELLSASRSGGIYACETYNDGTAGTERAVAIQTDELNFPPEMVGRFSTILIEGTIINSMSDPMMATLTAGNVTKTYPLVQSGNRLLYYVGLPADLCGQFVKFGLSGSISAGEIRRIAIGTLELRRSS